MHQYRPNLPISLALAVAMALILSAGCSDGNTDVTDVSDPAGDLAALSTDAFAVIGAEDAFSAVGYATLDSDMTMQPVEADDDFRRHPNHPHHAGSHLGPILRQLDLTSEQIEDVKSLIRAHRDAIREPLRGLYEANREIIEAANHERRRIVEAHRNGEISREQAHQMLHSVSRVQHEAIRTNPDNAPFLQAICEARRDLFAGIRAVLDEDQVLLWDEWVARLPGPCFGE